MSTDECFLKPNIHLKEVKTLHEKDLANGHGAVYLPEALERKYPNAAREWVWQYAFPAKNLSVDPRTGIVRRHHMGQQGLQWAMKAALHKTDIAKAASVHTLRHYGERYKMVSDDRKPAKPASCSSIHSPFYH